MGQHAYLIIAHNQFELLQVLLECLDYVENDIYVHIDLKAGEVNLDQFYQTIKHSTLYFIRDRIDVRWGDFSQIKCELRLLEASVPMKYQYYHLMSGVDLPLKSQKEIHQYFDLNYGTEFVHFDAPCISAQTYKRISKYVFFSSRKKSLYEKITYHISMMLQLGIDRGKRNNIVYQKGANWFSISHDLATYVISNRKLIEKLFRYTRCADEFFIQTLVVNSDFIHRVSQNNFCDNYETILYCIDWIRGNPYEYKSEDYNFLVASNMLYARKFNWNNDKAVIIKIKDFVTAEKDI